MVLLGTVAVAAFVALVAVALIVADGEDDPASPAATNVDRTPRTGDRSRTGRPDSDRTDTEVILAALADIEAFWAEAFPAVYGRPYVPVRGGFHPYGPDTDLPPCPGIRRYDEIADNAFYCPDADLIAWDAAVLAPALRRDFGELTLAIVMAHEVGHAIQERVGAQGATVTLEQQADCFAGAWVASLAAGRSRAFTVTLGDLDSALAGMLLLRDAPGVAADDPDAHGSAFDRIGAFADGFDQGPGACAAYDDALVGSRLVAIPWLDQADFDRGGDLPYDEIVELAAADLEHYWSTVFTAAGLVWEPVGRLVPFDPDGRIPRCGGRIASPEDYIGAAFYCEADDFIAWDDVYLMPALYDEAGDFAVATVLGQQYSAAAQSRLGQGGQPLGLSLQADCLTGSWAASSFLEDRPDAVIILSPGDLDEAVMALLAQGAPPRDVERNRADRGTAFQRVTAFREGFMGGIAACTVYTEGG